MQGLFLNLSTVAFKYKGSQLIVRDEVVINAFEYIGNQCFKVVVDNTAADLLSEFVVYEFEGREQTEKFARLVANEYFEFEPETDFY